MQSRWWCENLVNPLFLAMRCDHQYPTASFEPFKPAESCKSFSIDGSSEGKCSNIGKCGCRCLWASIEKMSERIAIFFRKLSENGTIVDDGRAKRHDKFHIKMPERNSNVLETAFINMGIDKSKDVGTGSDIVIVGECVQFLFCEYG